MDTRIPMMGQQLDFAGAMSNGLAAGVAQQQAQRQNSLAQLYQTQGPQIMAGDPNALNSLARMDPNAAMGVQSNRMGIQVQQFNMDQARAQTAQAAQAAAAKLSADQLAQETAKAEQTLAGAMPIYAQMKAGDPAAAQRLTAYLQSHGIQATAENVDEMLFRSQVAVDALKAYQSAQPKPVDAPTYRPASAEEAALYGAAGGQIDTKTGKFDPINPPSNGVTITNADGSQTQIGGTGRGPKPPTEAEAKNAGFLIRMHDSGDILNKFESQGTDLVAKARSMDPTGLSNYAQSPEYQQYDQAKRDFLNSILRRESGAAISPGEFANAEQQYFPVPGDNPEVIAQKRKNRDNATAGVTVGAGTSAQNPLVQGSDGVASDPNDFSKMSVIQLGSVDIYKLTEAQQAQLSARLKELGF